MNRARAAICAIILSAVIIPASSLAEKSCIDWPRLMAQYELSLMPEGKSVLITPFTNFLKKSEDDWLSKGIRDYLADLMRSSKDLKVLAGPTAIYKGDVSTPDWQISGRYQRAGGDLRVYISFTEGSSGKLLKQLEARFPYPGNKDFFAKLADVARMLMGDMKAKHDSGKMKNVMNATASTEAYESYSKGRQILDDFNPASAPQADEHFKNAIKGDFRSPLGYEGIIAMNTFLGFANKQLHKPFGSYYQKAETELVKMKRLAKPAPAVFSYVSKKPQKLSRPDDSLDNRFLESNAAFMEALYSSKLGNLEGAAKALEKCTELVPEDAVCWYQLGTTYSKMGNVTKSGEALRKAREMDPCI